MQDEIEHTEWVCNHCGERNPLNFALCWNCGKGLEDAQRAEATELPDESDEATVSPAAATEQPFGRWTGWCELAAVLLVTVVYQIAEILVRGGWGAIPYPSADTATILVYLPRWIGLSTLLWILVRRDRLIVQPVPLKECNWFHEFSFAFLIMAVNWMLVPVVAMLTREHGLSKEQVAAFSMTSDWVWISYCSRFFFSAIYQEVLMRVYLQSKLESLLGNAWQAIVIAAIIFAIWHGYSLSGTLKVFASGMLYGSIYYFSRQVPRLVLAHWMYNLLVTYQRLH